MLTSLLATLLLSPLSVHVRVDGDGYLRFARNGRVVYAKEANLCVHDGRLGTTSGAELLPPIDASDADTYLKVELDGHFSIGSSSLWHRTGQLVLALFPKDAAPAPDGEFFVATERPTLSNPGEGLNGVIRTDAPASVDGAGHKSPIGSKTNAPLATKAPTPQHPNASTPKSEHRIQSNFSDAAEILIHADSIVPNESFTLGEVADIAAGPELKSRLAAVDLGRAPAIGVNRGIDSAFVLAKVRTAGFKPDHLTITAPSGSHLERASQTVTSTQLLEAAQAAVKAQLGLDVPLHLTANVTDAILPVGELTLQPATVLKSGNTMSLMIDLRVDDKHVTTRNLLLAPTAGTGDGVKPGQIVKVLAKLNGATVEMSGRARTGGWVGETITVVTDTGAVKTAIVTGSGTVEVKL